MKATTAPQALLILAGLLAPMIGGYVANDKTVIEPGNLLTGLAEGQAPILQHALIALPVFLALVLLLIGRRIQQIPHPFVAATLVLLVGSLGPSVAVSSYRAVSVNAWMEWAAYLVAFLACVSGLGRRLGPLALLGALFAGTAYISRVGVLDYLDMRRIDPTWRVFCNWSNPNAAAAMLVLGFFCALGLPKLQERSANLLLNLGVAIGGGLVLAALMLTGSKGGAILALPTGLVIFGLVGGRRHPAMFPVGAIVLGLSAVGFLKSMPFLGIGAALLFAIVALWPQRLHVARLGAAFAFAALMLGFFAATTPGGKPQISSSRLSAATDTQDQSSIFRLNLWKSAVALAKERPVTGWGLGSYRYESPRPGLVTATVFSHNSYLQLAAEAGIGPLLLFGAFLALWGRRTLRGSSRLPDAQRLPFAAAVGGAAAILAHCLVDSDLSYFGLGLAFFLVMGVATVLAADAVAPEFVPPPSRYAAAAGVAFVWIFFAYLGWADTAKSQVRFAQEHGQPGDITSIEGLASWDGDASYLWAWAQGPNVESALKRTYELLPTPRVARLTARLQTSRGDLMGAQATLSRVLSHDPNNLLALYQLLEVQQAANLETSAEATARRLVAIESTPYFKVRSLPQFVPTETYRARLYLASIEESPAKKAELLSGAVLGLRRYAEVTVPEVVRSSKANPPAETNGETLEKARSRCAEGAKAAREAAALYRGLGEAASTAKMAEQATALDAAVPSVPIP